MNATVALRVGLVALLASSRAQGGPSALKIVLSEPGIYRIGYEDLRKAGLAEPSLPSERLAVSCSGKPVPIAVVDGGDGRFGAGDWIELWGDPRDARGSAEAYAIQNAYVLRWSEGEPSRMTQGTVKRSAASRGASPFFVQRHMEEDRLLVRFPKRDGPADELWYWAKIGSLDQRPFRASLDLRDLDAASSQAVELAMSFRGWSKAPDRPEPAVMDHVVAVSVNGSPAGTAEWMGDDSFLFRADSATTRLFRPGANELTAEVVKRAEPGTSESRIDVALVNWIEVAYPRTADLGTVAWEARVRDDAPAVLSLTSPTAREFSVYGSDGSRTRSSDMASSVSDNVVTYSFDRPAGAVTLRVVPGGASRAPARVQAFDPSDLKAVQPADYIAIAHPTLAAALEPLLALHREEGLAVKLCTIDQVYDAFNDGLEDPRAIRSFLAYAREHYSPAPRFVLLAGDASWDTRNTLADDKNYSKWTRDINETPDRFARMQGETYGSASAINSRNLVPTWSYISWAGHSASDNWFACREGDFHPDLAIGRLPVVAPSEVSAIVEKTVEAATSPTFGHERRDVLFIADSDEAYQDITNMLVEPLSRRGFACHRIYARDGEADLSRHQASIREAIDAKPRLVHFLGHGGRFIWRTAAPDTNTSQDLFTLEDLDELRPGSVVPIVLSMTCYSAPFDHPNADSIGEKFLRLAKRGAVTVLGASWRNEPTHELSETLLKELLAGSTTIGEAVMRAKRQMTDQDLVELYNLLGDPAARLGVPAPASIRVSKQLRLHVEPPSPDFRGRAIVEWTDAAFDRVDGVEIPMEGPLEIEYEGARRADVRGCRVYLWNATTDRMAYAEAAD
ncbi:MAG: C25 family cysteine peptidase [Acidobacteriota bacterium]